MMSPRHQHKAPMARNNQTLPVGLFKPYNASTRNAATVSVIDHARVIKFEYIVYTPSVEAGSCAPQRYSIKFTRECPTMTEMRTVKPFFINRLYSKWNSIDSFLKVYPFIRIVHFLQVILGGIAPKPMVKDHLL